MNPQQLELPVQVGRRKRDATAAAHKSDIEALIPLAQELARKAGVSGVCVSDLRVVATQRGLLGASVGRKLSFLGAVMQAAGLTPTDQWRRSVIPGSNGNLNRCWRLK